MLQVAYAPPPSALPSLAGIEAEIGARSLRDYLELAWTVIEPETLFVGGYHIDAVSEHLEAVTDGLIRDLLIMMPPRHTKSLTASVAWPTWAWLKKPWLRFLFASYSSTLSTDHAVSSRRILESQWFKERWGISSEWASTHSSFELTTDQNIKTYYENTKRGYRISTSVGGTVTGHGGDFLVGDDLHNLDEIDSEVERKHVISWYRKVWSNRLNDPKTGCRVVIMQRGHLGDIAGWLLEHGYEALKLPTEYDPKKTVVTSIGWKDPRTKPGELLCPARFGEAENAKAKVDLGTAAYAAQHQQEPIPDGGLMFNRAMFPVVDVLPKAAPDGTPISVIARVRFWDAAGTEDAGCYTAGCRMAKLSNGQFVIEHMTRGQWESGDVDTVIKQTAVMDSRLVAIREEQEPGSAGKAVIAARKRTLPGYDYDGRPATGDKVTRAKPLKSQASVKNVLLLNGPWVEDFLAEIEMFPAGQYKDQVDAASGAFNEVATAVGTLTVTKLRGV